MHVYKSNIVIQQFYVLMYYRIWQGFGQPCLAWNAWIGNAYSPPQKKQTLSPNHHCVLKVGPVRVVLWLVLSGRRGDLQHVADQAAADRQHQEVSPMASATRKFNNTIIQVLVDPTELFPGVSCEHILWTFQEGFKTSAGSTKPFVLLETPRAWDQC